MKLTFLGTSAVFPTKERNHSSIAIDIGQEVLLFDCGEGTQRQINIAGISPMKISKIFITHWHGDHVLGLGGLLQSLAMNKREKPLEIFGPAGSSERFRHLLKSFDIFLPYKATIREIKSGKILETGSYEIFAQKVKHAINCFAFCFKEKDRRRINIDYLKKFGLKSSPLIKQLQEGKDVIWNGKKIKVKDATFVKKGRKFCYIVDAQSDLKLVSFARDADVLICESTFAGEHEELARERGHMTASQAGLLAKKANVRQLILTHFSQRYKDVNQLLNEGKKIFGNTMLARDFLTLEV